MKSITFRKLLYPYIEVHVVEGESAAEIINEGNDIHEQVVSERHLQCSLTPPNIHPVLVNDQLKLLNCSLSQLGNYQ